MTTGEEIYQWITDLFPICRSLSGDGVRETLRYYKNILPNLAIHEVPSGTKVFDWVVPDEWQIRDAYIANASGERIIDFKACNIHIISYSTPVDQWMTFTELDPYLHSLPNQPDAIPYMTSFYKRSWGFCLTENLRNELRKQPNAKYHVKIDSTLEPGHLTYGELIIPGNTNYEILLSANICHPSLANNELSGPSVMAGVARLIQNRQATNKYTYRILFIVETIGSIIYLSKHLQAMRDNTIAGFVLTCLGDNNAYTMIGSRLGNTLTDRVCRHVLTHHTPKFCDYSFIKKAGDERQYCSPGIDLPVCALARTKHSEYLEYHTSLDNLSYISAEGLQGGFDVVIKCIELVEANAKYRCTVLAEPQMGKRGLYPNVSTKVIFEKKFITMMNCLAYADGNHDLIDTAERINVYAGELIPVAKLLVEEGLLTKVQS